MTPACIQASPENLMTYISGNHFPPIVNQFLPKPWGFFFPGLACIHVATSVIGLNINLHALTGLFVSDIALLALSPSVLRQMLNTCFALSHSLLFNVDNIQLIRFSRYPVVSTCTPVLSHLNTLKLKPNRSINLPRSYSHTGSVRQWRHYFMPERSLSQSQLHAAAYFLLLWSFYENRAILIFGTFTCLCMGVLCDHHLLLKFTL